MTWWYTNIPKGSCCWKEDIPGVIVSGVKGGVINFTDCRFLLLLLLLCCFSFAKNTNKSDFTNWYKLCIMANYMFNHVREIKTSIPLFLYKHTHFKSLNPFFPLPGQLPSSFFPSTKISFFELYLLSDLQLLMFLQPLSRFF